MVILSGFGRFITPPPGPLLEEGVDPKKGVFWRLVWGIRFGGRFGGQNEVSNGFWWKIRVFWRFLVENKVFNDFWWKIRVLWRFMVENEVFDGLWRKIEILFYFWSRNDDFWLNDSFFVIFLVKTLLLEIYEKWTFFCIFLSFFGCDFLNYSDES